MLSKLSLIMIVSNIYNLDAVLKNIYSSTFKDFNLFLLVSSHEIAKSLRNNNYNLNIIEYDSNKSIFDMIIPFAATLSSEYISVINSYDIHSAERFDCQIIYMDSNKNINICSCLESSLNCHLSQKKLLDSRNNFINEEEINYATKCDFPALNLYTILFRKSFLLTISKYSSSFKFQSEIDLILYFLRYEKISKLSKSLYYVCNSQEISDYDYSIIDEKLSDFNKDNILNNQCYLNEVVNSKNNSLSNKNKFQYRVLVILESINVGGTETYIINLAKKLKESSIELCVITKKCTIREVFTLYNIPLYILDFNNKIEFKNTVYNIKNIKLIQFHMESDIALSPFLKEILNVPIILTIHGVYYNKNFLNNFLSYIDEIVFVSNNSKKYYIDLLNKKSFNNYHVICNGIDNSYNSISKNSLRKKLGIDTNDFLIIYCSRLSYSKSKLAALFLKSFKKLAKKNKNIYAVILGDGMYKLSIDLLIDKINHSLKSEKIFSLGNKFNVLEYYSESDLIIGTGRVALEAMSIGKAVISLGLDYKANIICSKTIKKLINSNFGDHPNSNITFFNKITNRLTSILKYLIKSKDTCSKLGLWNKSYSKNNLSLDNLVYYYKNFIDLNSNK